MNYTEHNLETISSLNLYNMTVEEMIDSDSKIGSHFHYSRGVWWRQVRPFFYQPVPFIKPVIPHQPGPKLLKALGGFYHAVPDATFGNGLITVNEVKDPTNYDLGTLELKGRYEIRKALASVQIRRIDNLDDLLNDGYQVYISWENRMKDLIVKKKDTEGYKRWITGVFQHPYVLILGAYFENRLIAFNTNYAVDGIAESSKLFGHSSFQHLRPSSALTYSYIKICQNNSGIFKICNGLRGHRPSLEQYKTKLGFHHVSYPAYIYLRPLVRPIVRWLMPIQYKRLMGEYEN